MIIRYRTAEVKVGLFSKKTVLVLQVLKKFPDGQTDHNGLPTSLACERFVDATVEDLKELQTQESTPQLVA